MGGEIYFCAGKSCPGYTYKASELGHPGSCAMDPTKRLRELAQENRKLRGMNEELRRLLEATEIHSQEG